MNSYSCNSVIGNLLFRGQDSERDRQVESAAFLGQVGGRQRNRDLALGKLKTGVQQGRFDAVAGFPHGGFRQTNDGHAGKTRR